MEEELDMAVDSGSPAGTPRAGRGRGAEHKPVQAKALSVLRTSTKVQQRSSKGPAAASARIMEETEDGSEECDGLAGLGQRKNNSISSRPRPAPAIISPPAVVESKKNATRGEWTQAEEYVLARKHCELGNKWTSISSFLPSRSDNDVKVRGKVWRARCARVA